jgi:putative two-component system response regulator
VQELKSNNNINIINRRILVIDDNEDIHKDFRAVLEHTGDPKVSVDEEEVAIFGADTGAFPTRQIHFQIDSAFQGQEGFEKVCQSLEQGQPYAMAFVDVRMPPGWDGVETIQRIWKEYSELQVVLCTAYSDYSWHEMIDKLGETDKLLILKKPFDNIEVRQIACSLTEKWELLNNLDLIVKQRTLQIAETRDITVFALAKLAESRDPETGKHLENIRAYSLILAEQLASEKAYTNEISKQFLEDLYRSSPLHDIGKVGIPDTILLKPGRLSNSEFELMKQHTVIGAEALEIAAEHSNAGGFLSMAASIARSHHERFDGSGYPDGLSGNDIPLVARIVALADVYDALTSVRVYKSALEPDIARSMIINESGKHFDPVIVDAFCNSWDRFLKASELIDNVDRQLVESAVSSDIRR